MRIIFTVILINLLAINSLIGQSLSITVTNNNLALVNETRSIEVKEGTNIKKISNLPQLLDPTSVHITTKKAAFEVIEQNFEYDLLNANKILNKSINQMIRISHPNGGTIRGTLLSSDGSNIVLETEEKELRIIPRNQEQQIILEDFNKTSSGLITQPTLVWLLHADKTSQTNAEVSYLTAGLTWHTEYVALLNENDSEADITAWVSLDNTCGKSFENSRLKLMAGDIHLITDRRPVQPRKMYLEATAAKATFEEKEFFEYHLYSLDRPTTIKNNQTKQIQLFPSTKAKVSKIFQYNYREDVKKVSVIISTENSKANGLGMPLPTGKVRIYKKDGSDLEFIGEDRIDHTARDERIKIEIGKAFDVIAERKIAERKKTGKQSEKFHITIEIRNHKKENISVQVIEPVFGYRNYEILKSNFNPVKKDAKAIEFLIPVKANSASTLNYELLYTW
jgi:hypothetical protein